MRRTKKPSPNPRRGLFDVDPSDMFTGLGFSGDEIRKWGDGTMKTLGIKSLAALVCISLGSLVVSTDAWAICSNKCQTGWDTCNTWCADHNKKTSSLNACLFRCANYWDSGKNPQSLTVDPSTPTPPPNYVPGHVTPPTTKQP
jgi:hypothetical protein